MIGKNSEYLNLLLLLIRPFDFRGALSVRLPYSKTYKLKIGFIVLVLSQHGCYRFQIKKCSKTNTSQLVCSRGGGCFPS